MHKKILIILYFLFWALPALAQVDTAWVRRYNGPGNEQDLALAIAVDGSGNIYVTGPSTGSGTGLDYATIKYYPNGDTAWVRRYNGPRNWDDQSHAIAVDGSGNVYVTGTDEDSVTQQDYATIKYYPNGSTAWVRRYGEPGIQGEGATAIAIDGSGNVYVTGRVNGSDSIYSDYATIKYYPNGDIAWVSKYNGSGGGHDEAHALAIDGSNNIYVTGHSLQDTIHPWNWDYATIKYYPNGSIAWARRYNGAGNGDDFANAIAVDGSGNVYVTGKSWGSGTNSDYATIKYDPNGNELWVRRYNGPGSGWDWAWAISVDDSGNVYVAGGSDGETNGDFATIKYYPNGDTAWVRRYNGPADDDDYAGDLSVDDFGNVYVTGDSWGSGTSGDYATIKYDTSGNQVWVKRYNGPANDWDGALAITVDDSGNVYVTGYSYDSGTEEDFATIKYVQREWTILAYLNGDNDLEEFAIYNINAMEMVGSSVQVSIVVQVDRIPGFDGTNGNWTDTRRYYIVGDSDPNVINSIRLDTLPPLGELNMGDPQTLVDFVNWGIDNYPANHYAVVVWDHGSGWYKKPFSGGFDDILFKGVSSDWTDGGTIGVSDGEWESVISQIRDHLGRKIDLVGLNACLMQMWEVMDITDEYADYMAGSEEVEYAPGWEYTGFLSSLTANPTMSPKELGGTIVGGSDQPTRSCVHLAKVPPLTVAVNDFASELLEAIEDPDNYAIVCAIRSQLHTEDHEFDTPSHIDLYDFAHRINDDNALPASLRDAANDLMTAVDDAVDSNRVQPAYHWAKGIAVYYPEHVSDYDNRYDHLPVASNTLWDDFISSFQRGDVNQDCLIDIADVVYLINYLFIGGPAPEPLDAGDANCDGVVDIADVVYLINYLFIGGSPPSC